MSKPIIGRLYRPKSYEFRLSDGTFFAFNRPLSQHEEFIQKTVLGISEQGYETYLRMVPSVWCSLTVCIAVVAAVVGLT